MIALFFCFFSSFHIILIKILHIYFLFFRVNTIKLKPISHIFITIKKNIKEKIKENFSLPHRLPRILSSLVIYKLKEQSNKNNKL